MIAIIVMGHGHFASGIVSALELIAGKQEKVTAIDFTAEMSVSDIQDRLEQTLNPEDTTLVLCDLLGGTPFKVAASLMASLAKPNCNVLAGLNLAMLIEASFARQTAASFDDLVLGLITYSKEGIVDWKTLSQQKDGTTDDELGGI
ncbi:PTS system,N-acetylgalactosamine-specific IIA component [Streptococcus pyogenes]|uniref:PTS sugar transporter subunit IIA n=1 Tax=Streptococcus pyogenes TaxID=1314 RepID=UPI00109D3C71|nr:PTS sugar transporter subunit IIA [Streptococcus pyogenes]VHG51064.1 PTS system,N-acetylgalactosamine-specific IIA component [Streptococcus pyogenes]HES9157019.1 PTS sugar transporter subunit IIA [Streptococcus pyogenes]